MNKYDLTLLEQLTADDTAVNRLLSPSTLALCMMALEDRAIFRGAWVDDGDPISAARWDAAAALVDLARHELLDLTQVIDGGSA